MGHRLPFTKTTSPLLKLIWEGDQAKAEDGLAELRKVAKNRYEVRWISVADSAFQAKWGTKRQQLSCFGEGARGRNRVKCPFHRLLC